MNHYHKEHSPKLTFFLRETETYMCRQISAHKTEAVLKYEKFTWIANRYSNSHKQKNKASFWHYLWKIILWCCDSVSAVKNDFSLAFRVAGMSKFLFWPFVLILRIKLSVVYWQSSLDSGLLNLCNKVTKYRTSEERQKTTVLNIKEAPHPLFLRESAIYIFSTRIYRVDIHEKAGIKNHAYFT